jgi:hypothetical protein
VLSSSLQKVIYTTVLLLSKQYYMGAEQKICDTLSRAGYDIRRGLGEARMFRNHRPLRQVSGLILLFALLGLSLAACSVSGVGSANPTATASTTQTATTTPVPTATTATNPFNVVSVQMALNPASIAGLACGTALTVDYIATFTVASNSPGGTVQFIYTTTNGRGTTPASLTFAPNEVTKTYTFSWQGTLEPDNVAPGLGGVIVSSPDALNSSLVQPAGTCTAAAQPTPTPTPSYGPFVVTSIELSAGPSLSGHACGSQFTETYTAVFHIKPNGPGGTIVFGYTTDNGRSGTDNSNNLHVNAGQTSVTYTFTWKGALPADHTAPGVGIVLMSAPNQGESPAADPSGSCQ